MWRNPADARIYQLDEFIEYERLEIAPRVRERHPEMAEETIERACGSIISLSVTEEGTRIAFASNVGAVQTEIVGTLLDDGTFLIFHDMKLREKIAKQLGLVNDRRRRRHEAHGRRRRG